MENENQTYVTYFILSGFPQDLKNSILFFISFFLMYILTLFLNIALICIVLLSPHLHTPMYYYLCNLSFLDLCYSSCTVPRFLIYVFSTNRRISFFACMVQMYIGVFLGETESILLVVMAFDRFLAIRYPLHYPVIMSWKVCKNITIIVWLGNFLMIALPSLSNPIVICKENIIHHFICEVLDIAKLTCKDYKKGIFFTSLFTLLAPFTFIMVSYICIISSIINIHSVHGRTKAFSTCTSHLTVVLMFYGTSMTIYIGQANYFSSGQKIYIFIIYGIVTPMLNPLIYSLRNNEIKAAIKKILVVNASSQAM